MQPTPLWGDCPRRRSRPRGVTRGGTVFTAMTPLIELPWPDGVRVAPGGNLEASAAHAPAGLGRFTARGPLLRLRTDDQLVALFRLGYDEAFDVIHDRYRQRLLAYTRQMLGGARTDAEDVLQDVFLRAYRALRHDDRPVTLRAWLYRVAHNRCVDHLRRPTPPPAEIYELSRVPQLDPS